MLLKKLTEEMIFQQNKAKEVDERKHPEFSEI